MVDKKNKYQNIFFIFGIVVLAIMVTQLDFAEVWKGLRHAGYWFFAVVALWAVLYIFNTAAWYIIIKSQENNDLPANAVKHTPVSFWWLYKITISGFALNYATPGGLMGGEPYYIITQPMNVFMGMVLGLITLFCLVGIWFFLKGYKKGLALRLMNILRHIPGAKKWAHGFIETHKEQLDNVDCQIAALHNQNPRTFLGAVLLELACRVVSSLEILFILMVLMPSVNFIQCILILAFTSLFANMLFFMPLQLGGREGGFLMSVNGLGMTASAGIFVALIVRVRELIWTAIGLLLIKVGRSKQPKNKN